MQKFYKKKNFSFCKYHTRGNDFILLDDRDEKFPKDEKYFLKNLCNRNLGIGADGVILLQNSKFQNFLKFRIFNSDGSEAMSCGNGLACFVHFASKILNLKVSFIEKLKENIFATIKDEKVFLEFPIPTIFEKFQKVQILDKNFEYFFLLAGVHHVVIFVEDLKNLDVYKYGREIRSLKKFMPRGTNVNFIKLDQNKLFIRTFEKGVEKETFSCGTGAIASAYMAKSLKNTKGKFQIFSKIGVADIDFNYHKKDVKSIIIGLKPNLIYSGRFDLKDF